MAEPEGNEASNYEALARGNRSRGRRLYFTNSAISSIDYSPRYSLQLIQVGPDGRMKLDPNFKIDFTKAPDGPARPHDMLLN